MYWLSFCRPDGPSFFSASSVGETAVMSWMMIAAEMYGSMKAALKASGSDVPMTNTMVDNIEKVQLGIAEQRKTAAESIAGMAVLQSHGAVERWARRYAAVNETHFESRVAELRANAWLLASARGSADVSYLASPVTGGGVAVGRVPQLFLLALQQGKKKPAEWAQAAWDVLAQQGQRLVKDGAALDTPEDNLAELRRQAAEFEAKQLPVLRALKVV